MRIRRSQAFALLLAGLFVLGVLARRDLPGEGILPAVYTAVVHKPLLAPLGLAPDATARLRDELEVALRENRELKAQLARERALFGQLAELPDWAGRVRAHPASVICVEPRKDNAGTFLITAGSSDGIREGMAVVDGPTLYGVVIHVEAKQARVRRVDDREFALEVEIETAGGPVPGVAVGDGRGGLEVRYLRGAAGIEAGAPAFTSAYRREIPRGLLVGRVEGVTDVDHDEVLEVTVEASAALEPLARVQVLFRG